MRSVEVRLTESLSRIEDGQPVMPHGRFFTDTLSDHVLALLLGLKFCGAGGLMAMQPSSRAFSTQARLPVALVSCPGGLFIWAVGASCGMLPGLCP